VGQVLDKTPSGKPIPGGLQLVLIDTHKMKDVYHYRLQQAMQQLPQAAYLHSETDHVYARHVCAEEKRRNRKGVEEWVQVSKENHLFDADLLAMACAEPEWPGGGVNLISGMAVKERGQEEWRGELKLNINPAMISERHGTDRRKINPWRR
jgi:hypothetical protein